MALPIEMAATLREQLKREQTQREFRRCNAWDGLVWMSPDNAVRHHQFQASLCSACNQCTLVERTFEVADQVRVQDASTQQQRRRIQKGGLRKLVKPLLKNQV